MAAEFGAHLTSTAAQSEEEPPSIFEILAEENLVTSLRPALNYLFKVLAENNPARFGKLYQYGDEIFTLLDLLLEHYYLKHYSASFAENFYGMKRVSEDSEEETQLPRTNRVKSLLCLVLFPYIKNKCDTLYENLQEAEDEGVQSQQAWKRRLCKAFMAVYPFIHFSWEGAVFCLQMAYIFGKSEFHSPLLKMAGVVLNNLSEDDLERQSEVKQPNLSGLGWRRFIVALLNRGLGVAAVSLSSGLSVGVFFLQFIEWWYASDQHAASITALPKPPPPKPQHHDNLPRLHTLCPLCNKIRTNDTALGTSGYVFCYPCIYSYVTTNSECPVTRYPSNTEHLVKLFLPDS